MNKSYYFNKLTTIGLILFCATVNGLAQVGVTSGVQTTGPRSAVVEEDNTLWYLTLFILILGLAGAIGWLYKSKAAAKVEKEKKEEEKLKAKEDELEDGALDADKELEWFNTLSQRSNERKAAKKNPKGKKGGKESKLTEIEIRERKRLQQQQAFERLPLNSINALIPAPPIEKLPLSNDEGLLSAIEQTQDEYEDDAEVRELALRILSKFRNRNSIDALTQIALYDLSSNLRSSAVLALADFDHESVFESILLACADPTREVRAAAARALFQLSSDRAEAWTRIAECEDEYRIVQAAKAAIESELVDRSIDRLVHDDKNHAYEAFALVALLVRAGETKEIFEVMENQRNKSVKFAILHCFKVLQDPDTLADLYTYVERNSLPEDLSNAANEVIKSFDLVAA